MAAIVPRSGPLSSARIFLPNATWNRGRDTSIVRSMPMPRIGLIVCALLGMVGCSSSGDGLAVAGKPSPTGAADAGVRAEADGGESTFTVRAGLVPDNGSLICAAELDREDDAGAAVSPLGVALIALNAPFRCQGNNADWSCECDGSSHH